MPFSLRLATLAAAALFLAAPAAAQDDDGLFQSGRLMLSLGGSLGSAGVSCDPKCSADRHGGPSFMIRGGSLVSPQVTVLLEVNTFQSNFRTEAANGRWTMSWYLIGLLWYPSDEETFFINIGAGFGFTRANITFPAVGPQPLNAADVGGAIGIGKDYYFRTDMAATPYVTYLFTDRTAAQIGRADSGAKFSADLIRVGVALTLF